MQLNPFLLFPLEFRRRAVCLALPALVCAMCARTRAVTPDELRAKAAVHVAAIRTAEITYIQELSAPSPVLSPGVLERSPGIDVVADLNAHVFTREQLVADYVNRRAKLTRTDLRDVDQLLTDHGLLRLQHRNLSRNMQRLYGDRRYNVYFRSASGEGMPPCLEIMPVKGGGRGRGMRSGIESGALEPRWFDQGAPIDFQDAIDGSPFVQITIDLGGRTMSIVADPAFDLRYRSVRVYNDGGGLLSELVASDYQIVDGIPFPFRQESRAYFGNGQLLKEKIITVESAAFNRPIGENALRIKIPANTEVMRFEPTSQYGVSVTKVAQFVDLDSAVNLVAKVNRAKSAE